MVKEMVCRCHKPKAMGQAACVNCNSIDSKIMLL